MKKSNPIQKFKKVNPRYRRFYPQHFSDFILLELIETQKKLKLAGVFEKAVPLKDRQDLAVLSISESKFLKFKIEFLSKLLTI